MMDVMFAALPFMKEGKVMHRIDAIYARQSVDRMDSISIESQIEYCRYETRGAPFQEYADKGYSGKNTDRPQFQEMLNDIRKGLIKRVICYKLDRCSRSILDFANMMDELQQHDVEFVSCTEKFDTSTPMGRAMLNICIVFAQLERETIQQRVTDAYHSRSLKGFYMGGRVPYGFKTEPYILHGKRTSRYVVCPEEADILRLIYNQYADPQVSVGDIVKYLVENGIVNSRTEDGHWDKARVAAMIKNPIYVKADLDIYHFFKNQGAKLHNNPEDYIGTNGCYLFTEKGEKRKILSLEGHHLVLAPHQGLIPSDIWLRCRRKCMNNKRVAKPNKAKNTWLAGKIKCKKCGYALVVRKSGEKRYLICSRHMQTLSSCEGVGGLIAEEIEAVVLNAIRERVSSIGELTAPSRPAEDPMINELKVKTAQCQNEIDLLLSRMDQAGDTLMGYIDERITQLDEKLTGWQIQLRQLEESARSGQVERRKISDCMSHWNALTNPDKMTVVDALIAVIHASKQEVSIEWKL